MQPNNMPATVLTEQQRFERLNTALTSASASIAAVAPAHMRVDRIRKIIVAAVTRNPLLLQCSPASIVRATINAVEIGLEPGSALGEAYLVPYRNNETGVYECQMIPGYRGLVALARRSGEIVSIEARVVYAADHFEVAYGFAPVLVHRPELLGDRGELAFVYAIAQLVGGGAQWDVMSRSEIEAIRQRSQTGRKGKGPCSTDYEEMARKTVIKRLAKYLPMTVELAQAVAYDNAAEAGERQYRDDEVLPVGELAARADDELLQRPSAPLLGTAMQDAIAKAKAAAAPAVEKVAPVAEVSAVAEIDATDADPYADELADNGGEPENVVQTPEPANAPVDEQPAKRGRRAVANERQAAIVVVDAEIWAAYCQRYGYDAERGFAGLPAGAQSTLRFATPNELAKRGLGFEA